MSRKQTIDERISVLEIKLKESYRREEILEEENRNLRRDQFRWFNEEECWVWQDDGENYLDSLVCPIVISKDQLEHYVLERINECLSEAIKMR